MLGKLIELKFCLDVGSSLSTYPCCRQVARKLSAICEQTLHYNNKKLPENIKRSIKHRLDIVT